MLLIWRVALSPPRISSMQSSGRTSFGVPSRSVAAHVATNSTALSARTVNDVRRGKYKAAG